MAVKIKMANVREMDELSQKETKVSTKNISKFVYLPLYILQFILYTVHPVQFVSIVNYTQHSRVCTIDK